MDAHLQALRRVAGECGDHGPAEVASWKVGQIRQKMRLKAYRDPPDMFKFGEIALRTIVEENSQCHAPC